MLELELASQVISAVLGESAQGLMRRRQGATSLRKALTEASRLTIDELAETAETREALRRLLFEGRRPRKLSLEEIGSSTLHDAMVRLVVAADAPDAEGVTPLGRMRLDRQQLIAVLEEKFRAEIAKRGQTGGTLEGLHTRVEAQYQNETLLREVRKRNGSDNDDAWHPGAFALPPRHELIGRVADMRRVRELVAAQPDTAERRVVTLHGMPGVGKTSFAIALAWELSRQSGRDVPFVSLRGWASGDDGEPAASADTRTVLGELLVACGMPGGDMADSSQMRASMWRAEVARRGFPALVLEDARDLVQIADLLPSSPDCIVIVTSRHRLTDFDTIEYRLEPLSSNDIVSAIAAARGKGESEAAERLAGLTGGLPLAYDIVIDALRRYQDLSMSDVADELEELWAERGDSEDSTLSRTVNQVWAAFELSYRRLNQHQQQALCLLSRQPGFDITVSSLSAMMDLPERKARLLLSELATANLIQPRHDTGWRFHDLIALYVNRRARSQLSTDEWSTALNRLIADQARRAATALECFTGPADGAGTDREAVVAWLSAERENLRHMVHLHGEDPESEAADHALRLADDLALPLLRLGFTNDSQHLCHRALDIARARGDRAAEARILTRLGKVGRMRDRYREALAHFGAAEGIYVELDDETGRASALAGAGHVHRLAWEHDEALTRFDTARALFAAHDDHGGLADCLLGMAEIAALRGEFAVSVAYYTEAAGLFDGLADRRGVAEATWGLAETARLTGDHEGAHKRYTRALGVFMDARDRLGEADCLRGLGELAREKGESAKAADYLERARRLHHRIGDRVGEADALHVLGGLAADGADMSAAGAYWQRALGLYRAIASPRVHEVEALMARCQEQA